MIVPSCGGEVCSDTQFRVIDVTLVMSHRPFCCLFGTDAVGPTQPHDPRPDGDTQPTGFRLGVVTRRTARPGFGRFEQRGSRTDHFRAREPQTQRVDPT